MNKIIKYRFLDGVAHRYGVVVKEDECNLTIKRLNDTDQFEIAKTAIEILPFEKKQNDKKQRVCRMCSVEKDITQFAKHGATSYRSYCLECFKVYVREHTTKVDYDPLKYIEKRDYILQKHKRWRDKKKLEQASMPKKKLGRPRKLPKEVVSGLVVMEPLVL